MSATELTEFIERLGADVPRPARPYEGETAPSPPVNDRRNAPPQDSHQWACWPDKTFAPCGTTWARLTNQPPDAMGARPLADVIQEVSGELLVMDSNAMAPEDRDDLARACGKPVIAIRPGTSLYGLSGVDYFVADTNALEPEDVTRLELHTGKLVIVKRPGTELCEVSIEELQQMVTAAEWRAERAREGSDMANTWGEWLRPALAAGPLGPDQAPFDLSPGLVTHDPDQARVLGRAQSWGWTCTRCGGRLLTAQGEPPVAPHCA